MGDGARIGDIDAYRDAIANVHGNPDRDAHPDRVPDGDIDGDAGCEPRRDGDPVPDRIT